jgi:hypothetical protein
MNSPNPNSPNDVGATSLREQSSATMGNHEPGPDNDSSIDEPAKSISLTLVYSLLGVALLTAIVIALFIVLPFYHR